MEIDSDVIETPPLVVIDGANVAHANMSLALSPLAALSLIISADSFWSSRGVRVITVLPAGMERAARDAGEAAWLRSAQEAGRLMMAPCRNAGDDDIFAIGLAVERDGYLMSNDRFGDHVNTIATAAGAPADAVVKWLAERVITFASVGDTITPHPFGVSAVLGRRVTRPVMPPRVLPPAALSGGVHSAASAPPPIPVYGADGSGRWAEGGGGGASVGVPQPLTFSFSIPVKSVGVVIGTRGETINAIQAASGARISVSPNSGDDSPERCVTLSGTSEAIAAAHATIMSVIQGTLRAASGPSAGGGARVATGLVSPTVLKQVECPANRIGAVIGRGGATVRGIEERSGCRIDVGGGGAGGGGGESRTIRVTGRCSEDCTSAVTELLGIINAA